MLMIISRVPSGRYSLLYAIISACPALGEVKEGGWPPQAGSVCHRGRTAEVGIRTPQATAPPTQYIYLRLSAPGCS